MSEDRARELAITDALLAIRAGVLVTYREWQRMSPFERAAWVAAREMFAGTPRKKKHNLAAVAAKIAEEG